MRVERDWAKTFRGEGLIGLTRGFMYAGASSVVASLWKVDDEATAELMKHFYTNMLQKGMRPAEALRAAQNTLRQDPQWQSPHFWAGFVLQGEFKEPIRMPATYRCPTRWFKTCRRCVAVATPCRNRLGLHAPPHNIRQQIHTDGLRIKSVIRCRSNSCRGFVARFRRQQR